MSPPEKTVRPVIAVVAPFFNEENVLHELFARLASVFDANPSCDWLAVLVDDGSSDTSAHLAFAQARRDSRFQTISLSRNFGFQAALSAGLDYCRGKVSAVVTMDADLQDPPEVIPRLVKEWSHGFDVVRATRTSRTETGWRRAAFDGFHRYFGALTHHRIPANSGTFGLMSAEALDAFCSLPERNRFLPGMRAWIGFATSEVLYERCARHAGEPRQGFMRLAAYALDGIFSFSYLPLRMLAIAGCLIASSGAFLGAYFIVRRLAGIEVAPTGFTTLVTLVLFMGGVHLTALGIIGEYIGRLYDEAKGRPLYVIRKTGTLTR